MKPIEYVWRMHLLVKFFEFKIDKNIPLKAIPKSSLGTILFAAGL